MKISFITDTLSSGGSERVITVLANKLSRNHSVEIICLRSNSSFYPVNDSVKVIYASNFCGDSIIKKLFWIKKYIPIDHTIIAFMLPVYLFTLTAFLFTNHRIIVSERNDPDSASLVRRIGRQVLLWRAQYVVVQTQRIAEKMPQYIHNRIRVIYNPISDSFVCGNALSTEKEDLIVSVGRLSPQKNQTMMIDGFKRVLNVYPNYRLEIYGDGESRQGILEYISSQGLKEKVMLRGRSNDIQSVISKAKIFVLTSNYEGMSNALMEAMYVGLPVISTDLSGARELIINGKNGIIIPIGDVNAFAQETVSLVSDEMKMRELGGKACKIREMIDVNCIVEKWDILIHSMDSNKV